MKIKTLIAEDEFVSRRLVHKLMSPYADCDLAADGIEAVEAFRVALEQGKPYGMVILDIMMPRMDGQTVLRTVRALEEKQGVQSTQGAKIVMMTALSDMKSVMEAYAGLCDAYLVKPISREQIPPLLEKVGLTAASAPD